MGKKKQKKGTPFGYLMMLIGLALVAVGVILAFSLVDQVTEIGTSVLGEENIKEPAILFGMVGVGIVVGFLGFVMRPRTVKK